MGRAARTFGHIAGGALAMLLSASAYALGPVDGEGPPTDVSTASHAFDAGLTGHVQVGAKF